MTEPTKNEWLLSEAQELINAMQTKVNSFGYIITLGGSVLTKGKSTNDLDLFAFPSGQRAALPIDMLMWFGGKFGPGKSTGTVTTRRPVAPPPVQYDTQGRPVVPEKLFKHQIEFDLKGRKIEVFVA